MRLIHKWARVLLFNVLLLMISVVLLELFFGEWFSTENQWERLNLIRNKRLLYDARGLYANADTILYIRDNNGFRGSYKSTDSIDILTIGGSTTDQRYITEGQTWQDHLAKRFLEEGKRISVVNAGVDGQSTFGHIKNFDWWFSSIPNLRVKFVLFYVGLNDFYKNDDYSNEDLVGPYSFLNLLQERSAFYSLIQTIRGLLRTHAEKISHNAIRPQDVVWVKEGLLKSYETVMQLRLSQYEKRLKILIEKARNAGMYPVFVTQPSRRYKITPEGLVGINEESNYNGVKYNGVDFYYMMGILNKTTIRVAEENGAAAIDAATELQWDDDDFYDVSHNTPTGTKKIGTYLHKVLSQRFGLGSRQLPY